MEKKLKYCKKLDSSIHEPICLEIETMRLNGMSFSLIKNALRQKYPNYKEGTLIIKYYEWKRSQPKQGE